jgi:hypothetical protein
VRRDKTIKEEVKGKVDVTEGQKYFKKEKRVMLGSDS